MSSGIQLISGRYLAAPPVLADGQIAPLLFGADGSLVSSPATASLVGPRSLDTNFGTLVQKTVKASAGRALSFSCRNLAGASRFLQLHDSAAVVPPVAIPLLTFLVPGMSTIIIGTDFFGESGDFVQGGVVFSTGITWAFSTTGPFFTAAAAADQFTQITFR